MIFIRPWLYVGRFQDTRNSNLLAGHQISAMLQLAEAVEQPGIETLYLAVDDAMPVAEQQLRQGVAFIRAQKRLDRVVLVACGAGQSRSVAFAVAAMQEEEGIGLLEALKIVHARHPQARPHPELWRSLCAYYGEPDSLREMLHIAWI